MRVRRVVPLAAALAAIAASCTEATVETPSPAPPGFDVGDGRDGLLYQEGSSAVVNECVGLTDGAGSRLVLATPFSVPLESGTRLLVHQVQDAFAVSGDVNPVYEAGDAGRWEIVAVTSMDGSAVNLEQSLEGSYGSETAGRRAQACVVPQYTDVTVSLGGLVADAWNGTSGGVIAFLATGTVTVDLEGEINASTFGFRGGVVSTVGTACSVALNDTTPDQGGGKGESLDGQAFGLFGRGNIATGGGGGNSRAAGGGGGAGAGAGGRGGAELNLCGPDYLTRGFGGAAVHRRAGEVLALGAGGGGGHADIGTATPGATGGGAIVLQGAALAGQGRIASNGATAATATTGAGGGGAGGTIVLRFLSSRFAGTVEALGGEGGYTPSGSGPGGGGGGGRISAAALLGTAGLNTFVAGGLNGTPGNSRGSGPGGIGALEL